MFENKITLHYVTCPRQLFGKCLKIVIEAKMALDYNIIVMGNFNSEYDQIKVWMVEAGLVDLTVENMVIDPKLVLGAELAFSTFYNCIFLPIIFPETHQIW